MTIKYETLWSAEGSFWESYRYEIGPIMRPKKDFLHNELRQPILFDLLYKEKPVPRGDFSYLNGYLMMLADSMPFWNRFDGRCISFNVF